ncbi:MAG: pyridoxal phosphate-dependent aminotransferase family protein [Actinomycetota bacterium]|nr:pyridoxal phosphate-dependent aminotransferase family protein [Actinomycetota bacterium]
MLDAVIDEVDGRMIRVGKRWLADFASCNYLGLDLDEEVIGSIQGYVDEWGTHPSWSRLLGSPVLYGEIEDKLTALLGAEDVLALPTITHIHTSVISILAGSGTIFLDSRAHKTIYDGCQLARHHGATVKRFTHDDPDDLASLLMKDKNSPQLICMDGVNSMTGNAPDIREFARVARDHDALLYIDDAHGFGVIGERSPNELCAYGTRGNSIVRYYGETYDNVILVGGLSKSYSSLLAFIACPPRLKSMLKIAAPPYLYSGPSPIASLATVLAGLKVNEKRGDALRLDLHRKTAKVLDCLRDLEIATPNESGLPIIEIPLAKHQDVDEVGRFLFEQGIYTTIAAYPLVPKSEVGFRIQITAANDDAQIKTLTEVLSELSEKFRLQTARTMSKWWDVPEKVSGAR